MSGTSASELRARRRSADAVRRFAMYLKTRRWLTGGEQASYDHAETNLLLQRLGRDGAAMVFGKATHNALSQQLQRHVEADNVFEALEVSGEASSVADAELRTWRLRTVHAVYQQQLLVHLKAPLASCGDVLAELEQLPRHESSAASSMPELLAWLMYLDARDLFSPASVEEADARMCASLGMLKLSRALSWIEDVPQCRGDKPKETRKRTHTTMKALLEKLKDLVQRPTGQEPLADLPLQSRLCCDRIARLLFLVWLENSKDAPAFRKAESSKDVSANHHPHWWDFPPSHSKVTFPVLQHAIQLVQRNVFRPGKLVHWEAWVPSVKEQETLAAEIAAVARHLASLRDPSRLAHHLSHHFTQRASLSSNSAQRGAADAVLTPSLLSAAGVPDAMSVPVLRGAMKQASAAACVSLGPDLVFVADPDQRFQVVDGLLALQQHLSRQLHQRAMKRDSLTSLLHHLRQRAQRSVEARSRADARHLPVVRRYLDSLIGDNKVAADVRKTLADMFRRDPSFIDVRAKAASIPAEVIPGAMAAFRTRLKSVMEHGTARDGREIQHLDDFLARAAQALSARSPEEAEKDAATVVFAAGLLRRWHTDDTAAAAGISNWAEQAQVLGKVFAPSVPLDWEAVYAHGKVELRAKAVAALAELERLVQLLLATRVDRYPMLERVWSMLEHGYVFSSSKEDKKIAESLMKELSVIADDPRTKRSSVYHDAASKAKVLRGLLSRGHSSSSDVAQVQGPILRALRLLLTGHRCVRRIQQYLETRADCPAGLARGRADVGLLRDFDVCLDALELTITPGEVDVREPDSVLPAAAWLLRQCIERLPRALARCRGATDLVSCLPRALRPEAQAELDALGFACGIVLDNDEVAGTVLAEAPQQDRVRGQLRRTRAHLVHRSDATAGHARGILDLERLDDITDAIKVIGRRDHNGNVSAVLVGRDVALEWPDRVPRTMPRTHGLRGGKLQMAIFKCARPGAESTKACKCLPGPGGKKCVFGVLCRRAILRASVDHLRGLAITTLPGYNYLAEDAADRRRALALLPLRLITVFTPGQHYQERRLRIRVIPDKVAIDDQDAFVTPDEMRVVLDFRSDLERWNDRKGQLDVLQRERWAMLCTRFPVSRAAFLFHLAVTSIHGDTLPPLRPVGSAAPTEAYVLPDQLMVSLRYNSQQEESLDMLFPHAVQHPILLTPDQLRCDRDTGQGPGSSLAWSQSWEQCCANGLGIELSYADLCGVNGVFRQQAERLLCGTEPLHDLVVVGVKFSADGAETSVLLDALLQAHANQATLSIDPPTTPTNNTETARSPFARSRARHPNDLWQDLCAVDSRQSHASPSDQALAHLTAFSATQPALLDAPDGELLPDAAAGSLLAQLLGVPFSSLRYCPGAGGREDLEQAALNHLVYGATLGHTLDQWLRPAATDDEDVKPSELGEAAQTAVWRFFLSAVRGAGQHAALRIEDNAYGIVPVCLESSLKQDPAPGAPEALRKLVASVLYDEWKLMANDSAKVSRIGGSDRHDVDFAAIMRSDAVSVNVFKVDSFNLRVLSSTDVVKDAWFRDRYRAMRHDAEELVEKASDRVAGGKRKVQNDLYAGQQIIKPAMSDRPDSMHPFFSVSPAAADGSAGVGAGKDDVEDAPTVLPPGMVHVPIIRTNTRRNLQAVLAAVSSAAGGADATVRQGDVDAVLLDQPGLIDHLAWRSLRHYVGITSPVDRVDALAKLQAALRYVMASLPDVTDLDEAAISANSGLVRLRRLWASSLDCCSHRLDAWVCGLAHASLRDRATQRAVGAYGYVELLRREENPRSSSEDVRVVEQDAQGGFVIAPSLDHARTAAVLRSAAIAFDQDAPARESIDQDDVAVGLVSERAARGLYLMHGLSRGEPLPQLLAYRVERRMRDISESSTAGTVMHMLDTLRERYPPASGADATSATTSFDGLALVQDMLVADSKAQLACLLAECYPQDPRDVAVLMRVLADVADDFDAIGDVCLAEGVHAAIKGDFPRSNAISRFLTGHENALRPEDVEVLRVPSGGKSVELVVALVLPPVASLPLQHEPAALAWSNASQRACASPSFEMLARRLLGPADQISCRVQLVKTAFRAEHDRYAETAQGQALDRGIVITAADLGIGALDFVLECGDAALRDDAHISDMEKRIVRAARRSMTAVYPSDMMHELWQPAARRQWRLRVVSLEPAYDRFDSGRADKPLHRSFDQAWSLGYALRRVLCKGTELPPTRLVSRHTAQQLGHATPPLASEEKRLAAVRHRFQLCIDELDAALEQLRGLAGATASQRAISSAMQRLCAALDAAATSGVPNAIVAFDPAELVNIVRCWDDCDAVSKKLTGLSEKLLVRALETLTRQAADVLRSLQRRAADVAAMPVPAEDSGRRIARNMQAVTRKLLGASMPVEVRYASQRDSVYRVDFPAPNIARSREPPELRRAIDGPETPLSLRPAGVSDNDAQAIASRVAALESWLQHAAMTRPDVALLDCLRTVHGCMASPADAVTLHLHASQTPEWTGPEPGNVTAMAAAVKSNSFFDGCPDWVAGRIGDQALHVMRPGRVRSVISVLPSGDPPGSTYTGLEVDAWEEVIPQRQVQAAVAFHYDQPNTEPPQAILVAGAPASGWERGEDPRSTLRQVAQVVRDTMQLARMRAVDCVPDLRSDIRDFGMIPSALQPFIPATYGPEAAVDEADLPGAGV